MTLYENVDLALTGLLPQLASEKAVSLNPPCLQVVKTLIDQAK